MLFHLAKLKEKTNLKPLKFKIKYYKKTKKDFARLQLKLLKEMFLDPNLF